MIGLPQKELSKRTGRDRASDAGQIHRRWAGWRLRAVNHEIIASGEGYWNQSGCLNAIKLVQSSYSALVYQA